MPEEKRKRGRPTEEPKESLVRARIDIETKAKLDKYCIKYDMSLSDATRKAIKEMLKDEI